jgi:hypothetical protein
MATAEGVGKNEALFREVNERIRELNDGFDNSTEDPVDFVCECSLEGCRDYVPLTLADYADVRADPTHFLVAPGHVWHPDNERDIARHERYWIVEKVGPAADAAASEQ